MGVLLRYKIAWALPYIDQKYFLHAHSHFAFAGWVSQALMALLVAYLSEKNANINLTKYRLLLYLNLFTAYGMLLWFAIQGYAFLSILFSTLSIFVSYAFIIIYWRDLSALKINSISHSWFKVALIFNAISSLGPFLLAYMMATKHMIQNLYLGSVYFFLHFQYNGWFFFACMGLLYYRLEKFQIPKHTLKQVFWLFAISCIPVFFLSVLWLKIPLWLYLIVIIAASMQIIGWWILVKSIRKTIVEIKGRIPRLGKNLFLLSAVALTIKLCLQTGSVIPSLSKLAFGFRPIVIGYLHLVLLGVISIFIIAYMYSYNFLTINKSTKRGIIIFIFGVLLNEILLMIQGIADLNYESVPYIPVLLFITALTLLTGITLINYGQIQNMRSVTNRPAVITEL
jgi:hypothetical protein